MNKEGFILLLIILLLVLVSCVQDDYVCWDNICDSGEDVNTCPTDCKSQIISGGCGTVSPSARDACCTNSLGKPAFFDTNNNLCVFKTTPQPLSVCGDGICDLIQEDEFSCSKDCKIQPAPSDSCVGWDKKEYKMVFVLITQPGIKPTQEEISVITEIKKRFSEDFHYATENKLNIDTTYPVVIIEQDHSDPRMAMNKVYQNHPDIFDYAVIYVNFGVYDGAINQIVMRKIKGLGSEQFHGVVPFDESQGYGSNHVLRSVIREDNINHHVNFKKQFNLANVCDFLHGNPCKMLLHEISHNWGITVGDKEGTNAILGIQSQDRHWSIYFDCKHDPLCKGVSWEEESPGIFSSGSPPAKLKYHPFTLYFMGVLKPQEITESFILISPKGDLYSKNNKLYVEGTAKKISIQDIINYEGARTCVN